MARLLTAQAGARPCHRRSNERADRAVTCCHRTALIAAGQAGLDTQDISTHVCVDVINGRQTTAGAATVQQR